MILKLKQQDHYFLIFNPLTYEIIDLKISKDKPSNSIEISYKDFIKYKKYPKIIPKFYDINNKKLIFDDLDTLKQKLIFKLKQDFQKVQYLGYNSKTINKKINSRREDLENMRILLSYMQKNNLDKIQFRIYNNSFVEITQEQLKNMIEELEQYGIELYKRKWQIEEKINNIKNFKDFISIKWNSYLELSNVS